LQVLYIGTDIALARSLMDRDMGVGVCEDSRPERIEERAKSGAYDAALIDFRGSALDLLIIKTLREQGLLLPIIGIFPRNDMTTWPESRSVFLENGGDDLISGPAIRELIATVHAVVRRTKGFSSSVFEFLVGSALVRVNLLDQSLYVNGRLVQFTRHERVLFMHLALNKGKIVSMDELRRVLCRMNTDARTSEESLKVHISRMRTKLARIAPETKYLIITERAAGYRFRS